MSQSPLGYLPNEILSYIFALGSSCYSLELPYRDEPLYPHVISLVCSKWRYIALNSGNLWSNITLTWFGPHYDQSIFVYKIWASRAGGHPINVTLDLTRLASNHVHNVLRDTIIPYRVKRLDITLSHEQLSHSSLSDLDLDIDELAIVLIDFPGPDFIVPPFFSRAQSMDFRITCWVEYDHFSNLYVLWHKLRVLKCSGTIPFPSWLDVLRQTPFLEECALTVCGIRGIGIDRLEAVTVPNLRSLEIDFDGIHPDIVIPFISAPKVTTLEIASLDEWSNDTYDIIKNQYKLNQLRKLALYPTRQFPLRVIDVLTDAPMIYALLLGGEVIMGDETQEKIASGQLGPFLTQLILHGCGNNANEWLDMVEARRKNARAMLQTVNNWQATFTSLRCVKFRQVENREDCVERAMLLGVEVYYDW